MAAGDGKAAVDVVEEAAYLLRGAPASAIAAYYIGTLPFLLAFLFFWADMGRSATAYEHAAPAALGIAALFLWMSACQAIFTQRLRSTLTGGAPPPMLRLAFIQATLQPGKLVILPLAVLLTVPLPAVFAFYQNLMAISYDDTKGIRGLSATARRQASLWPVQNWIVLGLLFMLAVVVFLNVGVLLLMAPQLLKTLLGVDTPLTRSALLAFNSTFLAITAAMTYALIDPLIKAIYVVRCFYGESRATGEDLKAKLKSIAAQAAAGAALLAFLSGGTSVQAQPSTQSIDRSIDNVLKRAEFSWRLPHPAPKIEQKNWFVRAVNGAFDRLDQWIDDFARWLHERFRPNGPAQVEKSALPRLQAWVYVLMGAAILIFLVLFARLFRSRRITGVAEAVTTTRAEAAIDDASADQLPPDEWLRAARECIARNDLRLAVRALYLASLAYLGARSLIAIDRGKSNRDYTRELRRRARSTPEILPIFGDTVAVFERSWYGMYDVDSDLVTRLERNFTTMRGCVEQ